MSEYTLSVRPINSRIGYDKKKIMRVRGRDFYLSYHEPAWIEGMRWIGMRKEKELVKSFAINYLKKANLEGFRGIEIKIDHSF